MQSVVTRWLWQSVVTRWLWPATLDWEVFGTGLGCRGKALCPWARHLTCKCTLSTQEWMGRAYLVGQWLLVFDQLPAPLKMAAGCMFPGELSYSTGMNRSCNQGNRSRFLGRLDHVSNKVWLINIEFERRRTRTRRKEVTTRWPVVRLQQSVTKYDHFPRDHWQQSSFSYWKDPDFILLTDPMVVIKLIVIMTIIIIMKFLSSANWAGAPCS